MAKTEYKVRLALAKCSQGSMNNNINLPLDHGVLKEDIEAPLLNANDHVPGEHIIHFGRCQSKMNPDNKEEMCSFDIFSLGSRLIKSLMGCSGCKCSPQTFIPWTEEQSDCFIDGAPALTQDSVLHCQYGGVITFLTDEEAKADQEKYDDEQRTDYYNAIEGK